MLLPPSHTTGHTCSVARRFPQSKYARLATRSIKPCAKARCSDDAGSTCRSAKAAASDTPTPPAPQTTGRRLESNNSICPPVKFCDSVLLETPKTDSLIPRIRPFPTRAGTMASADFSRLLAERCRSVSPLSCGQNARPPRVSCNSFHRPSPDLHTHPYG